MAVNELGMASTDIVVTGKKWFLRIRIYYFTGMEQQSTVLRVASHNYCAKLFRLVSMLQNSFQM
jgi:hypothetical protein